MLVEPFRATDVLVAGGRTLAFPHPDPVQALLLSSLLFCSLSELSYCHHIAPTLAANMCACMIAIELRQVWLAGVTVTFEEHLMTVDSDTGELVGALEAQVATGQFIK